jgi:basic amino acid/polyamine antiporter, APA family
VLTYYAVANASALTQDRAHRRWPRSLAVVGLAGCLALAVAVPVTSLVAGVLVLGVGLVARLLARFLTRLPVGRRRRPGQP